MGSMDEAYDSPDSDGHASIPSPTETSFMSTVHNKRNWPPSSPSPRPTEDSSDDEDGPIVVYRHRGMKSTRMLPRSLDPSPSPSRVKPTIDGDSAHSTPRQTRKRGIENMVPTESEMSSYNELKAGYHAGTEGNGARDLHYSGKSVSGSENFAELPTPGRMLTSTADPKSTSDPQAGLSKRIAVRNIRSSPLKGTSPIRAESPTRARERPLSGNDGLSSGDEGDTELPPSTQPSQPLANSSAPTDGSSSETKEPMLPDSPEGVAELDKRPLIQKQSRAVSGMSTGSVVRNETFEEIDPSEIIDKISQSYEKSSEAVLPSQSPRTAPTAVSGGPINANSFSDNVPGSPAKVRGGLSSGSAIPQTPPNKNISKRRYVQTRGGSNPNFSAKKSGPGLSTPTIEGSSAPLSSASMTPKKEISVELFDVQKSSGKAPDAPSEGSTPEGQSRTSSPELGVKQSPEGVTMDENTPEQSPHTAEGTIDSTTPRFPYNNFSLWKLKASKSARRVSMNSLPSQSSLSTTTTEFLRKDPPSPLDSDFRSSQDQLGDRRPATAPLQPSAPADIFTDSEEADGQIPPPNSTTNTPAVRSTRPPLIEHLAETKTRDRSRSDPLDSQASATAAALARDEHQRPLFTPSRVEKVGGLAPIGQTSSTTEQDTTQEEESTAAESSSGDTTIEQHIDAVREDKSSGSEDENNGLETEGNRESSNGNRLWSGFSQDFQQDHRRYEADEEPIQEIDGDEMSTSHAHDASPGNRSLRLDDVEDATSRRHRIAELSQTDPAQRLAFDIPNGLMLQYEEQYRQVDDDNAAHRSPVNRRTTAETNVQARQYAQQLAELRVKVSALEKAAREREEEKAAHEHTIRHLRGALDQKVNSTINEPLKKMVWDLERQLQEEKQARIEAVAATEEKYMVMLEEQEAEYNHLQAELDDFVNCMPVDHSTHTSRIFEADDADDWLDEKRELSQFFDETIDHIFTEIRGDPEREDFDEAAEEAETSLRHMANEAGYEGLNKASLAAFGIRQMREENTLLREMYTESEDKMKELRSSHEDLCLEADSLKSKVLQLEDENIALQKSVSERQTTIENMQGEIKELQLYLTEKTAALEKTMAENERLSGLEEQIKVLNAEFATLQRSYSLCQQELEKQKTHTAQAEAKAKEHAEGLSNLRNELQNSNEQASTLQAEVDAYKQRNSELLRTVETADKAHKDQVMTLEQQIDDLVIAKETLTKERDSARASDGRFSEMSIKVRNLEEQISTTTSLMESLRTEKSALETSFQKVETEAKQARSRFNVLFHESSEKEAIWNNVKSTLQSEIEQKSRELHHAVEPYHNALSRIAIEINEVAPKRVGDQELYQRLAEMLVDEDIAEVEAVAGILAGVKAMDETIDDTEQRRNELEDKNQRLKVAISKWNGEHQKDKGKVEGLKKENKELALKLKAEKKQSDEKIGQLILALRR
ncbi:hypothetical protein BDD12DRAFT_495365 [Trichophaea hybrida]|nr:hypothetical protein BDD12DRAFT_495365 [Trichophaea hybrida]